MTARVDLWMPEGRPAPSPVAWSNVAGGVLSLSPTGSDVLLLTVPIATGAVPLDSGLWCALWMSWSAKSATPGKFSFAQNRFICAVKGASSPGGYIAYGPNLDGDAVASLSPGFCFDAPLGLPAYVALSYAINGSGDLEVALNCRSTDNTSAAGVAWEFAELSAKYRIFGAT